MNYLQLVNDFMIESNIDDQVVTVTGQVDDSLKATTWVRDAWLQIQRSERWSFMAAEGSFNTVASTSTYTIAEEEYDISSFRIAALSRDVYPIDLGHVRFQTTEAAPTRVAQLINRDVFFSPIPDAVYTITYDAWADPVTLTSDTDTPTLPAQFHKAIVWLALKNYAREQGAEWNGLYVAATREYNHMHSDMIRKYLPVMERKLPLTY